ncbi:hypothetical protein U1Q18_028517 [Sarracenia purpurea var. burkii]
MPNSTVTYLIREKKIDGLIGKEGFSVWFSSVLGFISDNLGGAEGEGGAKGFGHISGNHPAEIKGFSKFRNSDFWKSVAESIDLVQSERI